MKQFISLFILTLLFAGCKKDDPDPREAFVGVYKVTYQSTTLLKNNQTVTGTSSSIVSVNKGQHSDELTMTSGDQVITAQISGSTFTIPKVTVKTTINGVDNYSDLAEGSGSFTTTTLKIRTVIVSSNGTTTNIGEGPKQ